MENSIKSVEHDDKAILSTGDDFYFGSKSLWDNTANAKRTSFQDIVGGKSLDQKEQLTKLRQSNIEKNRAYIEMHVPAGDESRQLTLLNFLRYTGLARLFPKSEDIEEVLRDRKLLSDICGAVIPIILCIIIASSAKAINSENLMIGRTLGVTVLIAGWWLAAPWPDIATSWSPVWLYPMAGVIPSSVAASKYMNNTIMLLIGAFLVDLCIEESGAGTRLGLIAIKRFGNRPLALLFGFMVVAWGLSMFCANVSVSMMLMPFVLGILERIDEANKDGNPQGARRFAKASLLGVAYACSIGGMATTIGTAPNLIMTGEMAANFGTKHEPTFTEYFLMCLPSACFLLVLAYGVIYVKWARNLNLKVPVDVVTVQLEALGGVTFDEKIVAVVQALQIALWMSRKESVPGTSGWSEEEDSPWKGNPGFWGDGGVALMCAFTLFLIPSRSRPGESVLTYEMTKHLPWDIIAMMGGGFAIAESVRVSGTAQWLADHLGNWAKTLHIIPFLMCLCLTVTFLTEIASNTATATILMPVLIPAAIAADLHPLVLLVPACIACSTAFMLPMATGPNAVVFSMKRLSVEDMASTGLYLNIMSGILLPVFMLATVFPIGGFGSLATGADKAPSWATLDDNAAGGCR